MKRLLLLMSVGCHVPTDPSGVEIGRTPATDAGAALALACGGSPLLRPYGMLHLYLVPTLGTQDGLTVADRVRGPSIWVDRSLRDEPRIWAHAMLHSMYDLPGHTLTDHPSAFWRCGLDPRQL